MRKFRIFAAVLTMIVLTAATLSGCGKSSHSNYSDPASGEVKIKGQVDGGVESTRGFGGKNN